MCLYITNIRHAFLFLFKSLLGMDLKQGWFHIQFFINEKIQGVDTLTVQYFPI